MLIISDVKIIKTNPENFVNRHIYFYGLWHIVTVTKIQLQAGKAIALWGSK